MIKLSANKFAVKEVEHGNEENQRTSDHVEVAQIG